MHQLCCFLFRSWRHSYSCRSWLKLKAVPHLSTPLPVSGTHAPLSSSTTSQHRATQDPTAAPACTACKPALMHIPIAVHLRTMPQIAWQHIQDRLRALMMAQHMRRVKGSTVCPVKVQVRSEVIRQATLSLTCKL